MQEKVYHARKLDSVDQLKQAIVQKWHAQPQHFIDLIIGEWRRHLQCVVDQNGGHIEHRPTLYKMSVR